jgi:uncharacterized membrane protein
MAWLKNTDGNPSSSFTMMIISFIVITAWLVVSVFETIKGVHIRPFNGTDAMAYFAPIAALYYGRRQQEIAKGVSTNE